ncbi:uncharacterized protein BDZ99DRAFT_457669 [Mytilinidion resinicola]|uniref:C2H2-type domain-containing protein n=1 Tax=Mytilinidion resinicola TaxID=574789 RepID=A0A6A6Z4E9_9PEZI|nr:uncharacterized protein BDZ99DRAFT_457669 [Mytilinidion resinicola]KAF2815698.1 hypothetical protein BDZ99DRAFT_457669 [Mytilinidion resinicola]
MLHNGNTPSALLYGPITPVMEFSHEPKDIYHSQNSFLSSGLLTPSTPVYEGRRDSIVSTQSYAQSYGSGSFYSPKTPPTPISQRDPATEDFTFVHAVSSFDGTAVSASEDVFCECISEVPTPLPQSMRGMENHSPFPQEWVYVQQQNQYPIRQGILHSNDSSPAARDLPSAFNALLGPQAQAQPSVGGLPDSNSWSIYSNNAHGIPDAGPHDLGYSYAHPPSLSNNVQVDQWPASTSGQVFPCIGATNTIRPEHSVFDMEDGSAYIPMQPDSFDESFSSYDTCSSPMLHSQQDSYPDIPTEDYPQVKTEESDAEEYDIKPQRRIYESPTGGKGVKKEHRVSKKKPKRGKTKSFISTLQTGDVQVQMERDIERSVDGKYYRRHGGDQKKLPCEFEGCDKTFARPEHKKRHEQTHENLKLYECAICEKPFNRHDNCLAHYITHVMRVDGKSKRNKPYPLSEMEVMIRRRLRKIGRHEEGEKIIEWIQNKILGEADQKPAKMAVRASL